MSKNLFFYLLMLLVFVASIAFVINKGEEAYPNKNIVYSTQKYITVKNQYPASQSIEANNNDNGLSVIWKQFAEKFSHPLSILILQIIVIIIVARLLGMLFGKIGQPTVIGEIIAGIILGPSLLGNYFPEISSFLFRPDSLKNLEILSQIGLVLFMFIIGMELDVKILRIRVKSALIISHTSILIAYFAGVLIAYFLYPTYASQNTSFTNFALFVGIAMSIAAFPVLARIMQERGMTKTAFGKQMITIAAIDDITAWCILAVVIAVIQAGSFLSAGFTIFLVMLYLVFMLYLVQPMMSKIASVYISKEIFNKKIVALVFIILFISAYFTEIIGIKALFGGFLAGVIMPSNQHFKKVMAEKIEDFSLVVLLPLFFVFTGLRTHIGLISEGDLWSTCGWIILFAITGKFGGSFLAAKITGQNWRNASIIGTLMNTRGLMELIVLNIGYDLHILSTEVFTMLVVMTLVTTFMTGPVLSIVDYFDRKKKISIVEQADVNKLNVLISFGLPKMGTSLLKIIYALSGKEKSVHKFSALHLTPHTEVTQSDAVKYETNSFAPIRSLANEFKVELKTIYKTTEDVTKEILKTVRKEKSNLLLMGAAKSVFNKNVLGGKVRNIIDQAKCTVGVFIDKEFHEINNVLILSDNINFERLSNICERLLTNSECKIVFMNSEGADDLANLKINNERIQYIDHIKNMDASFLKKFDLLITNNDYFERTLSENSSMLDSSPSLLLLNFIGQSF